MKKSRNEATRTKRSIFMPSFPNSPRLIKGGLVLLDPTTSSVVRSVALQYNPDTLTRTLQAQTTGTDTPDRSEALRLKGPPIETIKVEAEIDATDQMEKGDATVATLGILPILSALELIVYPSSDQLVATDNLANSGTLEIAPGWPRWSCSCGARAGSYRCA